MPRLLHLDAAAHRGAESVTRRLGVAFAEIWNDSHAVAGYEHHDLALMPAPPLDSAYCELGRRLERVGRLPFEHIGGQVADAAERASWAATRPLIESLLAADVVLIAAPMYNFGMPAALKAWIDRVTFPGVLDPADDPGGPLTGKTFVIVAAHGGCYGPGTPRAALNFYLPHLVGWLTAYRADPRRIHTVVAEATLATLSPALDMLRHTGEASAQAALRDATQLAHALSESAA